MNQEDSRQPQEADKKRLLPIFLQFLLSLTVIGGAIALAAYYMNTAPKAKPKKRIPRPPLVEVAGIHIGSQRYVVECMGTVIGADTLDLTPRVSGEIIEVSGEFMPGGHFMRESTILKIDPTDYTLALRQLQSEVAKAQNDLDLEMGNQRIARKEFELLGQKVSSTEKKLMLRMPQLGIAKANLEGIQAKLQQARLNLERTVVTAPINSVVLKKNVGPGSRVTPTTSLAKLTGTDKFWIRLTIPVDQLQWLNIPTNRSQSGSKVHIYSGNSNTSQYRSGHLIRLGPGLEENGRMALVYAEVDDPLCLRPENRPLPRLLLDSLVRVEIDGREFTDTVVITRDHLRAKDQVWLLDKDNRLEFRTVKIIARARDKVFISSGLFESDRLITTAIPDTTEGIKLQLQKGRKQKKKTTESDR